MTSPQSPDRRKAKLIQFAKKGNIKAITALLNRFLQSKGIVISKLALKDHCLHIFVESAQIPKKEKVAILIRDFMLHLGIESIKRVKISGRCTEDTTSNWSREIQVLKQPDVLLSKEPACETDKQEKDLQQKEFEATEMISIEQDKDQDSDYSEIKNQQKHTFFKTAERASKNISSHFNQLTKTVSNSVGDVVKELSKDPEPTLPFSPYSHEVRSVTFMHELDKIASAGNDFKIKLWNWRKGRVLEEFLGHSKAVTTIAIHPNEEILASGSEDMKIKLWDLKRRDNNATLKGHSHFIQSIAFSPDGLTLASASKDETIKLWNIKTCKEVLTISQDSGCINAILFSPDGLLLFGGSSDRKIKAWDPKTGTLVYTLEAHSSAVNALAITSNGKILASGSSDKKIKLWDVTTNKLLHTFIGHSHKVISLAISPEDSILASGSLDKTIKLWNLKTKKQIETLDKHRGRINSVTFHEKDWRLASCSLDETIKIWEPVGCLFSLLAGLSFGVVSLFVFILINSSDDNESLLFVLCFLFGLIAVCFISVSIRLAIVNSVIMIKNLCNASNKEKGHESFSGDGKVNILGIFELFIQCILLFILGILSILTGGGGG
ncbi:WD40 repeat domain-containing protein [Lusitaniella coriacea]|uniref:WD40 repeat domain-containing protein n=1 Tax=Lusitaniella coriacea TaxID=1983105 RepID=UPI003CF08F6D